ncbi:MAG: phage tail tube protein [Paracoccaceae bacterium]
MSKVAGRKIRIYQGAGGSRTLVAGARSDSISINNEAIDVTDKSSDGWRILLDDASVRSVDMSVEGILDGDSLLSAALGNTTDLLGLYTIDIFGIGICEGDFHFSSFEIGAPHDDAATFTANIQSAGPIRFTAGGSSAKPVNTVAPTITGTAQVGEILTAVDGTWTGIPTPTYAYQWQADGTDIAAADASTFTLTAAEEDALITVEVTASNLAGDTTAESLPTTAVIPA